MTRARAVARGPVGFTDGNGKQASLPLTAIFFDTSGVGAEGGVYTANKTVVDPWLAYLAKSGLLVPGAEAPARTAFVINAKDPGSYGNAIQIAFSSFDETDPDTPKFDAVLSATNTYTQVTPAAVQAALGSSAGGGTSRGLVFVPGATPTELPKAGIYPLAVTDPNAFASAEIPTESGSGVAFTLQAKGDGPDGALTVVEIQDVDTAAGTFSLVAKWTKSASQITASDIGSNFDYLIAVEPPSSGSISAPAEGTITLSGGSDTGGAPASAAVPA